MGNKSISKSKLLENYYSENYNILSMLKYDSNNLIFITEDLIYIYDIFEKTIKLKIEEFSEFKIYNIFKLNNNDLIICLNDNSLRIITIDTKNNSYYNHATYKEISEKITQIINIINDKILLSTDSGNIFVTSQISYSKKFKIENKLIEHKKSITSLLEIPNNREFISCSSISQIILVWSSFNFKNQFIFDKINISQFNNSVSLIKENIFAVAGIEIILINLTQRKIIKKINVKYKIDCILSLNNDEILTGGIRIFNPNNKKKNKGKTIGISNKENNYSALYIWKFNNKNLIKKFKGYILHEKKSIQMNNLLYFNDIIVFNIKNENIYFWKYEMMNNNHEK